MYKVKFEDEKTPQDTIEASIREETHGDLIEIEIQGDRAEMVYLSKDNARVLGEYLITLSNS